MCNHPCRYEPASCPQWPPWEDRPFTALLLYCWQREYDTRPYTNFRFSRLDFEERMHRNYHCIRDFRTIVKFLLQRNDLLFISISSVGISSWDARLLQEFAFSLLNVPRMELRLMRLPYEFYVMLRLNASKMKIRELSLEGTELSERDAEMLREFLLVNQTLHTLNVSSCNLSQYNFATVADGVHKSSSMRNFCANRLVGLHLSLDTEKIVSIVGSLLMQNKLVELTMQQCEFIAQDMEIIAEYLSLKDCSLRKLNLAYNLIASDGALFLIRAIAQGGKLEQLDLSSNEIGSHGGKWIAHYFSSCLMLQHLYLNDNQIGVEAVNLILSTLKKPCRLKRLKLYGNNFNIRTALILRRLLDSQVLFQKEIDISYTYDEVLQNYRIVPWR